MRKKIKIIVSLFISFTLFLSLMLFTKQVYAANTVSYEGKVFSVDTTGDFIRIYVDGVMKSNNAVISWDEVVQYDAYIMSIDNITIISANDQYGIPIPNVRINWTQYRTTGPIQRILEVPIKNLIPIPLFSPTFTTNGNMITVSFPANAFYKKYRINTGLWQNYTTPISTSDRIEAIGADKFGNLTGIAYFQTQNPPQIQINTTPSGPTSSVKIQVSITDSTGIAESKYAFGNQNVDYMSSNGIVLPYTNSVDVIENGTYTIYAKNNGGLKSIKTITISNIDRIAPVKPTFSVSPTIPSYTVNVAINFPSDANKKQYRIENGSWSNYISPISVNTNTTVYAFATDIAGNQSEIASLVISNIKTSNEYVYDSNGRLVRLNSKFGNFIFHYDDNGNLVKKEKIN